MIRKLNVAMAVAAAVCAVAAPALAQDERDYLLGTQLVLTSTTQLVMPENAWWAELLPMEYSYAQGTIVKVVNAARAARGVSEMIDYKSYPIAVGGEMPVDNGYEYNVDFMRMTPADVEVVLEQFPLTGALSDLETQLRAVKTGWFNANGAEGNATLTIFNQSETFTRDDSFNSAKAKAAGLLERVFGRPVDFDMSFNNYFSLGGYSSIDINLTVYLEGFDNGMGDPRPYYSEGEGGI